MQPIYTAFFTIGTRYEEEVKTLRASLDNLGLPHDIRGIPSRGTWAANAGYTATHICTLLADYPNRPVVQLDADAVVLEAPTLFDELLASDADMAVHWRRGQELLNGTIWFNTTLAARMVAQTYRDLITANPSCTNEQKMLDVAIKDCGDLLKVEKLPPGYCYIPDIMAGDLADGESVVIRHHQASRESSPGSDPWHRRQKWLAEVNGAR